MSLFLFYRFVNQNKAFLSIHQTIRLKFILILDEKKIYIYIVFRNNIDDLEPIITLILLLLTLFV